MQHLNLTSANRVSDQADQKLLGLPESKDELSLLQEMLFQTRTETTRLRRRLDRRDLEYQAHVRYSRVLWVATLLFAAGFVAVLWLSLNENGSIPGVGGSASELKIPDTGLQPPKPPIAPAANDAALMNTEVSPKPERQASSGSSGTLLLADSVKRSRTDFVLPLNKTWEVSPGIFLTVRETSVESQRIDGSLQIAEEGRTVPIRNQGLQTPATFSTKRDERRAAVVFTRIDKQQVAGYLLIPIPVG